MAQQRIGKGQQEDVEEAGKDVLDALNGIVVDDVGVDGAVLVEGCVGAGRKGQVAEERGPKAQVDDRQHPVRSIILGLVLDRKYLLGVSTHETDKSYVLVAAKSKDHDGVGSEADQ